ncbi:MAG: hypothetical protein IJH34_14005, partial [Romboutsia sp.]|nr:hypothetical protein [Romboutsia sp.]
KDDNIKKILEFIKQYKAEKIEIFKIHNLAESKYKSIGKEMIKYSKVEDKSVENIYNRIKKVNDRVEIIKI